jgi:hypothetical protein
MTEREMAPPKSDIFKSGSPLATPKFVPDFSVFIKKQHIFFFSNLRSP